MDKKCEDCRYENKCACYDCSRLKRKDMFEPKIIEIRPEQGGELWSFENELGGVDYIFVMEGDDAGELRYTDSTGESTDQTPVTMVHGKNGWKLLHSPDKEVMDRIKEVEDDSVERIENKDVEIESCYDDIILKTSKLDKAIMFNKFKGNVTIELPKFDNKVKA